MRNLVLGQLHAEHRRLGLGLAWALLNPMAMILIYFLAFRYVLGVTHVDRYPLFISLGILHWVLWSQILNRATSSLIRNSGFMLQVSFPRSIIPLSVVGKGVVEHAFAIGAFIVVAPLLGWVPWWGGLTYFAVLALSIVMVAGAGFFLAALAVFFQDLQQLVPILLRLGFFSSPVLYRFDRLSEGWQELLNRLPFAPFLHSIRDLLYYNAMPGLDAWTSMIGWAVVSFVIGAWFFDRTRNSFTEWL